MRRKRITLSFDNGPHLHGTPLVLRALAERDLQAWFFLVGERLREPSLRELAQQTRAAGHRIGNHTLTHGAPLGLRPAEDAVHEIDETQALLNDLASGMVFRPNGDMGRLGPHLLSPTAAQHLAAKGYTAVNWNCVPRDWERPDDGWVGRALDTIERQEWTLIVLHDHTAGTQLHLASFLDRLIAEGCEFSTDFPPDTVMLREGRPMAGLDRMVTVPAR
jgi:peptidoglycan/xylan/chitin deacetylase (PgdA/CDA1 family)